MITVGDETYPWEPGMTLTTVMGRLKDADCYAVVKLNDRLVSRPNFGTTPVADGARIVPIPMIAGG